MNEMDVLRTEYSFFEIVMLKFGHFSMSINICLIIKFHKIIKVKTCFFYIFGQKSHWNCDTEKNDHRPIM